MPTSRRTPPRVLGIDPSLTATGLSTGQWCDTIHTTGKRGDSLALRRIRIDRICAAILDHATGVDLAVIEGPAFRAADPGVWDRAGLWWRIVGKLLAADIPVAVVPPTCRARYAAGKGNASKDTVLAATIRRYPDVVVANNNEADALILAAMGLDWAGHPLAAVPVVNRTGLDKVAWPETLAGAA